MNLNKPHSAKRIEHSELHYALCAPRSANLYTMKKLLRYFGLIGLLAIVLALYSFGNAVVCEYALTDLEKTLERIETALLSLVAVMFIILVIAYWRDEL